MGNPFDVFDNQPEQGPMTVGIRRPPEPKTPTPQNPEQRQSTIVSTERAQQGMVYDRAGAIDKARDGYRQDKRVLKYEEAIPVYFSGLQSPENAAGDNLLVNAMAKVSDPSTGVQAREGASWEQAQSGLDQLKASMLKQFGTDGYGNFTPEGRKKIRETLSVRMRALADQYRAARSDQINYINSLNLPGVDPETIIGPSAGDAFQGQEKAYLGHAPTLNYKQTSDGSLIDATTGAPIDPQTGQRTPDGAPPPPTTTERGFDIAPSGTTPTASGEDFRNSLFAAMKSGQIKSPADIHAFEQQYNQSHQTGWHVDADNPDTMRAIKAARSGKQFNVDLPRPDISDVRGGKNSNLQDAFNAGVRGIVDSLSLGTVDKGVAAGDTLFKGGPMDYNKARQYAISDYDQDQHPIARLTGQAGGAAMLPMGEMKGVGQIALKSAAMGGAYGVGSSRSLGEVPQNALLGAVGGGVVGGTLASVGKGINALAVGTGRKLAGQTTPEQRAILDAGAQESVPVNMTDIYPQTRNTAATLETIPGASGSIRKGIGQGADAIEGRVSDLGRGGTARDNMGDTIQGAGERFLARGKRQYKRLYKAAETQAGGVDIEAQDAPNVLAQLVAREDATPGGTKAGAVIKQYADSLQPGQKITIDGARRMRSELLSRLREDGGLSKKEATNVTGQIMAAVNSDIERSLADAGKTGAVQAYKFADKFYAQHMDEVSNVLEKFLGTEKAPKSPEQTLALMQSMASPKGDAGRMTRMLSHMRPDEKADFAATLAQNLGRKSADEPFTLGAFLQNARKLSPQSRKIIFGDAGAKSIENLVTLANAKQGTVNRLNNSRSGQVSNYRNVMSQLLVGLPGGGALLGAGAAFNGATGAAGGAAIGGTMVLGARTLAKAFMNEEFTRAIAQAPASVSPKAINAHFGRLKQIAAKDPSVRAVVENLEQKLLSHANDNASRMGSAAASPDEGPDKKKQPQR